MKYRLLRAMQQQLPSIIAQQKMLPSGKEELERSTCPTGAKQSAVLILFCPDVAGDYFVPVILRTSDTSPHSGQISFPGGKYEEQDIDFKTTALRETAEELGIDTSHIVILKALTGLYIPVSNFYIHPFVGFTEEVLKFSPSDFEVQKIIKINIDQLANPQITIKKIQLRGHFYEVPFYEFNEASIWGATAMILAELIEMLNTSPKFFNKS